MIPAGNSVQGKKIAGFVAELADTTSAVSTTTTEVVSTSITFTAYANVRYKVSYTGNRESTVAADGIACKLRWKNSGTADVTGTPFATSGSCQPQHASFGHPFFMVGTFSSQDAGTVTVVSTVQRFGGTGTVKQNATSSGGRLYFLVEIC